jgi:glycerol-3-phosphate dehydrogenase
MIRDQMLTQLQQTPEWDIVIIGGGATGLGCAVDAASRGFKTLLIEQYDFAKGTSSRSTKLVHGGVRYLAQGNIKLVKEALRERAYLLRNAPNVTSVMAFVVPAYSWWDKWFYGIGLKVYDLLAGKLSLGKTRWLNKRETLQQLPGVNSNKLKGGILYFDGQFDDARLAIDLAKTAIQQGATVVNYCKAQSFIKENNRIDAVVINDEINNNTYKVKAKIFINATGVFADAVMQMDEPHKDSLIAPSQGIHAVVNREFFPSNNALMIPKTDDGRVLFAVPWHNVVILGTTDTPITQITPEPKPLEEEIQFILHHANRYLAKTITRKDINSVFVGLRPLIKKTDTATTSLLSRDHTILVSKAGLITVSGGKWTTYRKMAEDVIDRAIQIAQLPQKTCITRQLPIQTTTIKEAENLNEFIHPDFPFTEQDIRYFVKEEMAMTIEDILARRTRILFLNARVAITVAPIVAGLMAGILQRDDQWTLGQITAFTILANQYNVAPE